MEKPEVQVTIGYVLDIYVAKSNRIGDKSLQRAVDVVKGLFLGPYGLVALTEGVKSACDDASKYFQPFKVPLTISFHPSWGYLPLEKFENVPRHLVANEKNTY